MNFYPREYTAILNSIQKIEEENSSIQNQTYNLPDLSETDYARDINTHTKELSSSTNNISEAVKDLYLSLHDTVLNDLETAQQMYNFAINTCEDENVYSEIENFPFNDWYNAISFTWQPQLRWLSSISKTMNKSSEHFELFKGNLKDFLNLYEKKVSLHKYAKKILVELKDFLIKNDASFLINEIVYNSNLEEEKKWGFWSQANLNSLIDSNKDYSQELVIFRSFLSQSENREEITNKFLNDIFNTNLASKSLFIYRNNNPESYVVGIKWENLNNLAINILNSDLNIENELLDTLASFLEKKNIDLTKNDGEINYRSFLSIIKNHKLNKSLPINNEKITKLKI